MSDKNTIWENPQDELLDTPKSSTPFIANEILDINDEIDVQKEPKKNYIVRNGKKYYLTDKHYVYKCEDGYYSYRIVHKPSNTNTFVNSHRETGEKFNTAKKAYDALQEHLNAVKTDKSYKFRNVTFSDMWEDIKRTTAKEEATITKYDSIFNQHIKYEFAETPMQDLDHETINTYLEKMYKTGDGHGTGQAGYSYTFVESILKFCWLVFQHAFAKNVISAEVVTKFEKFVKMPKNDDAKDIRILNQEEIQKVYDLLKDTDYLLPFLVSIYTGARPAEAFAVRFSDFDFEKETLSINKQIVEFGGKLVFKSPKTFAREVQIPYILICEVQKRMKMLEKAKKEKPDLFDLNRKRVEYAMQNQPKGKDFIYDDMITMGLDGKYNALSSFQYYAKIIRKEICVNDDKRENFSFYCFRKTAISVMASFNMPMGSLMRITGHKRESTLWQYYYSDENEFAKERTKEIIHSFNGIINLQK